MLRNSKVLHNKYDRETLAKKLAAEEFSRRTISFYRYTTMDKVEALRDRLYEEWSELGCLGRVYLAREGINAQMSIPEPQLEDFLLKLNSFLPDIRIKYAIEDQSASFLKLIVRIKKKIVADGLEDESFDTANVGKHLNAKEFNDAMALKDAVVVDMRNSYESEVGHFKGALLPQALSFKEELPVVKDMLAGKEKQKILLYCTGGIRCEKASAWLKHEGFEDVNQLHGGIIDYAKQVSQDNLENKFVGKNFVFDERLGERISSEVVSHCHICGVKADMQKNCSLQSCHTLFVYCKDCGEELDGHCSVECQQGIPPSDQSRKSALSAKANPRKVKPIREV